MNLNFKGKYKSITEFNWENVPNFVVITGPNGCGKSQLLELLYYTIVRSKTTSERILISEKIIQPSEVTYLKGEWQLQDTQFVNLTSIQAYVDTLFNQFRQYRQNPSSMRFNENELRRESIFKDVLKKIGKTNAQPITKEEFEVHLPELIVEQERQLSQKIGEVFYHYRLSEIELKAEGTSPERIISKIGEKPWNVLREIIKESKLPFEINDPSNKGIRDSFQLQITHTIIKEKVNFNDLSSGEKVLMSLVFYLYSSQEKKVFPKLLLLDEPDAHLHPSMSQQFLNVVKNVLVDKFGVQVIMTTHSPSTVILAPEDSVYEMSQFEPRIKKSDSKNHSVSLLTAGLVYVGEGTKYFLVEDKDDAEFYTYIYDKLTTDNLIGADIPLVFIPASTKDKSGGKSVVQNWVEKLRDSGLVNILHGLIDADSGNSVSTGVYKINRYSIENYLADPILVYAALIDKEKNMEIDGLKLFVGEEYKLKFLESETLQKIADKILSLCESEIRNCFPKFNSIAECEKETITFNNGKILLYPKWLLKRPGKMIINEVYNKVFKSNVVNFSALFKAFKKLNMFPDDIVSTFSEITTP